MASHLGLLKPINTHRVNQGRGDANEEEDEPLSPLARLFHAPQVNCFIVVVFGCKTTIDVDVFKHGLEQTLIKHPRFSSKLVFGIGKVEEPLKWARTIVNIDDHVIVPDLDPNMESPDEFVEDYASNITRTPMDLSKPLWELHILNVETSEAASTGVFRVHHSLGDGVSIISLLLACTRKASDTNAFPSLLVDKKKTKNAQTTSHSWFLGFVFTVMLMLKVFWNTLMDVTLLLATIICLKDNESPLKGGTGIEKTPKRFVHRMLNLNDIKLVKNALGVTVNDVAVGITQAGLSRYLYGRCGEAKGEKKDSEYNMLSHSRIRATLFVNLRPTTVVQDVANVINAGSNIGADWGNKIGYVLYPLHIKSRDDPLDYIYDAKATVDQKKRSLVARFTYFATSLLLKTLGLQVATAVMYKSLSNTTLTFSNVAGPMEEVSFFGHPMVFFAPSVYGLPQALVIHFQSYMDKMAVILSVDEDVIPDPHKLCCEIETSLMLAKNAVMAEKFAN